MTVINILRKLQSGSYVSATHTHTRTHIEKRGVELFCDKFINC